VPRALSAMSASFRESRISNLRPGSSLSDCRVRPSGCTAVIPFPAGGVSLRGSFSAASKRRKLESEIDGPLRWQYKRQGHTDEESAYVRPPGYTTCSGGLDGEHLKTREELDQEPVSEKDGCR
jgi:hypothetical protein